MTTEEVILSRQIIVVIVNYNTAILVRECVRSLKSEPIDRIIVFDNGSLDGDGDAEKLHALRHLDNRVSIEISAINHGFGGAVNRAVEIAALRNPGDCVWVLNPDTVVAPGATLVLANAVEAHPSSIVSPVIWSMDSDHTRAWYAGGDFDLSKGRVRHSTTLSGTGIYPTGYMTGAAPFLSCATWRTVGGFREDLFMYWEDADWGYRAQEKGVDLLVAASASIEHAVGGSTAEAGQRSLLYYFYMQRNRLVVAGGFGVPLVRLLFAAETCRLLVRPLKNEQRARWPKFLASLRGIMAGILAVKKGN